MGEVTSAPPSAAVLEFLVSFLLDFAGLGLEELSEDAAPFFSSGGLSPLPNGRSPFSSLVPGVGQNRSEWPRRPQEKQKWGMFSYWMSKGSVVPLLAESIKIHLLKGLLTSCAILAFTYAPT